MSRCCKTCDHQGEDCCGPEIWWYMCGLDNHTIFDIDKETCDQYDERVPLTWNAEGLYGIRQHIPKGRILKNYDFVPDDDSEPDSYDPV